MVSRYRWTLVVMLLLVAVPGNSCGPFFAEAHFVGDSAPTDVKSFVNGNIGVIRSVGVYGPLTWRYLMLSYRMLSGPPLTADEKASLLKGVEDRRNPDAINDSEIASAEGEWNKARSAVTSELGLLQESGAHAANDGSAPGNAAVVNSVDRPGADNEWDTYPNCLRDSFLNAARTLKARAQEHAADKASLAEWVKGQGAVFSNCGATGQIPQPLTQPAWLAKDRAYQIAAAHFYQPDLEQAQKEFAAIAFDTSSPWRELAAYLVGRCLIRQATLASEKTPDRDNYVKARLQQASLELSRVVKGGGPYAEAAQNMLNLVNLRIAPTADAVRIGNAVTRPDAHIEQDLVDLGGVLTIRGFDGGTQFRSNDAMDWIATMMDWAQPGTKGPDAGHAYADSHSAERWRQTGNVAWLVAAMCRTLTPAPDLVTAAAAVPKSSPAWVSLTYYRLRAMPAGAATRAEVERALNDLPKGTPPATRNEFTILARQKAESLTEFARLAPMQPYDIDDGIGDPLGPQGTMAGLPVNAKGVYRLDAESAAVLNQDLPLSELVQLVLDSQWPKQIRFELAMAVWTRAVLLNEPDEARKLTATMIAGEPGWKQWLTAYDAAETDGDRQATALLALMRFPSVRPYVNAGAGREEGFVGYSSYRDNWWCANMGREQNGADSYSTSVNDRGGAEITNPPQSLPMNLPTYISPAMKATADSEWAGLAKVGDASAYFGSKTLEYVRTHPKDPRDADLLGFAFRAMRNGCNLENSTAARKQIFDLLHSKYPESKWAQTYPTFESGDQ